ncbi:FK506-binding protein 5 isoform X1 [Solea solea]|uniref:FK506-binding protein 5 isoform X1 n=1 Tax=Solea solea TaxID=90069 RepID=UPI00272D5976|nr:FK506-binding protein 5 isoform X1 [Solea solea]
MDEEVPLSSIDSLLCHFGLQIRQLSQKKNEYNQQIEVCRAHIAECRSRIETLNKNIKELEEKIGVKQSSVKHNKDVAKSLKVTNSRLLQYEKMLKTELERRKASFNDDKEVFEERIAGYRKIFQSHKEHYCKNPLAQKLLGLQAENEEIECRIKACDDQVTMKQKELHHLTDLAATPNSSEKLPDSVCVELPIQELQEKPDPQIEDSDSAIDIECLHLKQTQTKESVEASAEDIQAEHQGQDTTTCSPEPQERSRELRSLEEQTEENLPNAMHIDEKEKETQLQDKVLEQQTNVSEMEEAVEVGDEDQPSREKDNKRHADFSQSPATAPSTPSFSFTYSPTRSPHTATSETKSPALLFSVNSDPITPCFSGFGFDMGPSQVEDTSFTFTNSLFNEKNTTEPKSSRTPEFLFGQSEQGEDFQFAFNFMSPQASSKDKNKDDFPFSFNF